MWMQWSVVVQSCVVNKSSAAMGTWLRTTGSPFTRVVEKTMYADRQQALVTMDGVEKGLEVVGRVEGGGLEGGARGESVWELCQTRRVSASSGFRLTRACRIQVPVIRSPNNINDLYLIPASHYELSFTIKHHLRPQQRAKCSDNRCPSPPPCLIIHSIRKIGSESCPACHMRKIRSDQMTVRMTSTPHGQIDFSLQITKMVPFLPICMYRVEHADFISAIQHSRLAFPKPPWLPVPESGGPCGRRIIPSSTMLVEIRLGPHPLRHFQRQVDLGCLR